MALVLVVLLVAVVATVGAVVFAVVWSGSRGRSVRDAHGHRSQWIGLALGAVVAAAVLAFDGPRYFHGLMLAPLLAAGWLAGVFVGERTRAAVPAPAGLVTAALTPRTVDRYVRRTAVGIMRASFATVTVLLGLALRWASPLDGAQYSAVCSAVTERSAGPWPGGTYAISGLAATAGVWILCELVLRAVVQRPTVAGTDVDDDGTRALVARTATTAGVLAAIPNLGLVSLTMGGVLLRTCPTPVQQIGAFVLVVGGIVVSISAAAAWLIALGSGGRAVVIPVAAR